MKAFAVGKGVMIFVVAFAVLGVWGALMVFSLAKTTGEGLLLGLTTGQREMEQGYT